MPRVCRPIVLPSRLAWGEHYTLLPFKGLYWQLDPRASFRFNTNLYPVPDLNVPFLGVHVTPSPDGTVSLGPTAIPALGRENYRGMDGIEPLMALQFLGDLASQWRRNAGGFRRYAREQALHGLKPLFLRAAQALVPSLRSEHLIPSHKAGILAHNSTIAAPAFWSKTFVLSRELRVPMS